MDQTEFLEKLNFTIFKKRNQILAKQPKLTSSELSKGYNKKISLFTNLLTNLLTHCNPSSYPSSYISLKGSPVIYPLISPTIFPLIFPTIFPMINGFERGEVKNG